jgi:hypothetical protein
MVLQCPHCVMMIKENKVCRICETYGIACEKQSRTQKPTQGAKNFTKEFFPFVNSSKFPLVSSAAPEALATEAEERAAKSARIVVFMLW